jgi:hypothetical protein
MYNIIFSFWPSGLLAIPLKQFSSLQQSFPFSNSFPFLKLPTPKSLPHKKAKSKSLKQKAKSPKQKLQYKNPKAKACYPPSVSLLYPVVNRVEQQFLERAMTL